MSLSKRCFDSSDILKVVIMKDYEDLSVLVETFFEFSFFVKCFFKWNR